MAIVNFSKAIELLQAGQVVAFPMETIYGMGCLVEETQAINQIYKLKGIKNTQPLTIYFKDFEQVYDYVGFVPEYAKKLLQQLTPGPVSVYLPLKNPQMSRFRPALGNSENVLCRVPDHEIAQKLIRTSNSPIVAASANKFGSFCPTNSQMVLDQFGEELPVLEGECEIGIESSIIDCTSSDSLTLIRPGLIGKSELEAIANRFGVRFIDQSQEPRLESLAVVDINSNYRISAKVEHIKNFTEITSSKQAVLVASSDILEKADQLLQSGNIQSVSLGSSFNLERIAKNFYENLSKIELLNPEIVYIMDEKWGDTSLAIAISDRLNKIVSDKM